MNKTASGRFVGLRLKRSEMEQTIIYYLLTILPGSIGDTACDLMEQTKKITIIYYLYCLAPPETRPAVVCLRAPMN